MIHFKHIVVVCSLMLLVSPLSFAQHKEGIKGTDFDTLRVSRLTAMIGNNSSMGELMGEILIEDGLKLLNATPMNK